MYNRAVKTYPKPSRRMSLHPVVPVNSSLLASLPAVPVESSSCCDMKTSRSKLAFPATSYLGLCDAFLTNPRCDTATPIKTSSDLFLSR